MDKEYATKEIVVRLRPSLHARLQAKCSANYKTISEVIRDFIFHFVKDQGSLHSAMAAVRTKFSCSSDGKRVIDGAGALVPQGGCVKADPHEKKIVEGSAVLRPVGAWLKEGK